MASNTMSAWPAWTSSPGSTRVSSTLPGMGATNPPPCCCEDAPGSMRSSAKVWPSRCTHHTSPTLAAWAKAVRPSAIVTCRRPRACRLTVVPSHAHPSSVLVSVTSTSSPFTLNRCCIRGTSLKGWRRGSPVRRPDLPHRCWLSCGACRTIPLLRRLSGRR